MEEIAGKVENPNSFSKSDEGTAKAAATMVATIPALLRPPVSLLALSSALSFSIVSNAKISR